MSKTSYADQYRNIDFRKHPEKYVIGRGEQGVLIAQPYKDEILPHWKFATSSKATESANKIYALFNTYMEQDDFVGADMARKFLQMGFTRARRYANHASGNKYDSAGKVTKQDDNSEQSEKAKSASIFKEYYDKARLNKGYIIARDKHKALKKNP